MNEKLFVLFLVEIFLFFAGSNETNEQQLIRKLLQFYEPSVRPVRQAQSVVNVSFRMEITQLFELEEKTQILTTNVRIEQKWIDENLSWNQSEHRPVRGIRLPSNRIWLPDSYIYNSAFDLSSNSATQGIVHGPYVMVYHNGEVVFPVLMKLRTTCKVNIQYFPFDQQICGLKFASWIYDSSSVNYELLSSSSEQYPSGNIRNSGWEVLDVKQDLIWRTKNNKTYGELVYGVHIRRRPLYYIFNVIIPCAMLSCLTCMSFWLPTSSGEKVTLGLNCFVAFSVFMLMVAEKVPATSDSVPIIGIYLTIVMSLTSISVIMAVIVANVYQHASMCTTEKNRAPRWLVKLTLMYLGPFLRMENKIKSVLSQRTENTVKHGLSLEPDFLPLTSNKTEFDMNYENLIENLLLQQILVYAQDRRDSYRRSSDIIDENQARRLLDKSAENDRKRRVTLSLIESDEEKPSNLIEDILQSYDQRQSQFDHNLIDLVVERNRARRHRSICPDSVFSFRLQWLAIGLVIDRAFFYLYFTATLISYFVTMFLIPYSHPNLIIDIKNL